MTDSIISRELVILFARPVQEGQAAMSDIYALTSSHLYGVIFRILKNDTDAAKVLNSVYACIQVNRSHEHSTEDLMNALRAIAHRFALDYKYSGKINSPDDYPAELSTLASGALNPKNRVPSGDTALLKQAYLDAASTAVLSKAAGCQPEDLRGKIKNIVTKMSQEKS